MATRLTGSAQNAAANAIVDLIDAGAGAGTLKIYTGSQPADADDAETGTLLATFTLPDPAFGNAANGVATANAISDATGAAAGTAGYFRVEDSTGANVMDGSVGTSGADLNLNTTTISVGLTVSITSWTVTMPAA